MGFRTIVTVNHDLLTDEPQKIGTAILEGMEGASWDHKEIHRDPVSVHPMRHASDFGLFFFTRGQLHDLSTGSESFKWKLENSLEWLKQDVKMAEEIVRFAKQAIKKQEAENDNS